VSLFIRNDYYSQGSIFWRHRQDADSPRQIFVPKSLGSSSPMKIQNLLFRLFEHSLGQTLLRLLQARGVILFASTMSRVVLSLGIATFCLSRVICNMLILIDILSLFFITHTYLFTAFSLIFYFWKLQLTASWSSVSLSIRIAGLYAIRDSTRSRSRIFHPP